MQLNELRDNAGARKARKRVGRGIGSGTGKTSGHGHKGQKARTGVAIKGFEGGQMPLQRRLPKRGFVHPKVPCSIVNLVDIQRASDRKRLDVGRPIDGQALQEAGLVRDGALPVRLLGKGTLKEKIQAVVAYVSEGARQAVEKAGGSVTLVTDAALKSE